MLHRFLQFITKHKIACLAVLIIFTFIFTQQVIAQATNELTAAKVGESYCGLGWGKDAGDNVFLCAINWVLMLIVGFFVWILSIVNNIFEWFIKFTVIEFGNTYKDYVKDSIESAWAVLRDLINITFIFGLLYQAIKIIIGLDGGSWKKTVGIILVSALLINFSLFFTKVMIDLSNGFAVAVYTTVFSTKDGSGANIGTTISKAMNLHSLVGSPDSSLQTTVSGSSSTKGVTPGNAIVINLCLVFFIIVLIFTMITIAGYMLQRFVIFLQLMILSPIGIAGYALPQLRSKQSDWWKDMQGQLVFAPLMFLALYIAILVLSGGTKGDGGLAKMVASSAKFEFFNIVIFFALSIAILILLVKYAKEMADKVSFSQSFSIGKTVGDWSDKMRGRAIHATTKGFATATGISVAQRHLINRPMNAMANSKWANKMASSKSSLLRGLGQTAVKAGKAGDKIVLDPSNFVGKSVGSDLSQRKGYSETLADQEKAIKESGEAYKKAVETSSAKKDEKALADIAKALGLKQISAEDAARLKDGRAQTDAHTIESIERLTAVEKASLLAAIDAQAQIEKDIETALANDPTVSSARNDEDIAESKLKAWREDKANQVEPKDMTADQRKELRSLEEDAKAAHKKTRKEEDDAIKGVGRAKLGLGAGRGDAETERNTAGANLKAEQSRIFGSLDKNVVAKITRVMETEYKKQTDLGVPVTTVHMSNALDGAVKDILRDDVNGVVETLKNNLSALYTGGGAAVNAALQTTIDGLQTSNKVLTKGIKSFVMKGGRAIDVVSKDADAERKEAKARIAETSRARHGALFTPFGLHITRSGRQAANRKFEEFNNR